MANELNFYGDLSQTGLTVEARVYDSSGTQVGSNVSCSEVGTLAIYVGDMPTATIGQYGVRFFDSSNTLLSQGVINWSGSKEIEFDISEILADTSELQANQGDWATATGFAVSGDEMNLANNSISSNKVQNNAFDNLAFTTNYYNSINSEVDTALNDYDAPTKSELDAAESNIINSVNSISFDDTAILNAIAALNDISTSNIRTELTTELARLDVSVSSVAYNDTAITNLINALPTLAEMEASSALTAIADITGLSTHDAADVVAAMQVVADDFKADVSDVSDIESTVNSIDSKVDSNSVKVEELWKLQGLDSSNPMTVTRTKRTVDDIDLVISGDGVNNTTVTRD